MRARLERWLVACWYGRATPVPWLRPFSLLYGGLRWLHAMPYRLGWRQPRRLPVPVVVVGNRVVGGTGKTPLVIALVRWLQSSGYRPGVVSRGYGRRSSAPVRVAMGMPSSLCGDEPLEIALATHAPVQVDADRVRAGALLAGEGCDVIVSDDGLQHRRLHRDVEIEVVDALRGYGNGALLPAGPLRSPASAHPHALQVVNGGDGSAGFSMNLRLADAIRLDGGERRPLVAFVDGPVCAMAGIGHPERFFQALRAAGLAVHARALPDHHDYRGDEWAGLPAGPLLVTGKDAVKLAGIAPADSWWVPVSAELPDAFFTAVAVRLETPNP